MSDLPTSVSNGTATTDVPATPNGNGNVEPKPAPLEGKTMWWIKTFALPGLALLVSFFALVWSVRKDTAELERLISRDAAEREKESHERAKNKKLEWQKAIVFGIIEEGDLKENKKKGMTFLKIKEAYEKKVVQQKILYTEYDLSKEDFDELKLRKILMDLLASKLIGLVYPGETYVVNVSALNPRAEKTYVEADMEYQILNTLMGDAGKYSIDQLYRQLVKGGDQGGAEEFNCSINRLLAAQMVKSGFREGKVIVWAAANPPPDFWATTMPGVAPRVIPVPVQERMPPLMPKTEEVKKE